MAVLRTEPLGWASYGARILDGGKELARLEITWLKGRGTFRLHNETFAIEPKGFFLSHAVLEKGSTALAKAHKPSAFRRRFEVTSAGHEFVLESQSWTGREYALFHGDQEVGWIKREGWTGRKLDLEFPDDMPVFLQIFLAYIVLAQMRREAAAAASGS